MKYKRQLIWIPRFALTLILFGALFPQGSAPEADEQLVAYFVTWHGTAKGFGHGIVYGHDQTVKDFRDSTGSAIVRFRQFRDGNLYSYDTRYLSVQIVHKQETWDLFLEPLLGCNVYYSEEIANPSENSGLYVPSGMGDAAHPNPAQLLNQSSKRADGFIEFREPLFNGLGTLRHSIHSAIRGMGGAPKIDCSAVREDTVSGPTVVFRLPPTPSTPEQMQKFVLQSVRPNDNSYFSMNVRFSNQGGVPGHSLANDATAKDFTEQVEWTAEAHRLGTCPCAVNSN